MKLEIVNYSKKYGKKTALDGFSFEFEKGIYGLLGPNGAGKTTLMKLLSGLLKSDSGELFIDGNTVNTRSEEYRKQIGYLPQSFGFYPFFSGREVLSYYSKLKDSQYDKEQISDLLESVNLTSAADDKVSGYSGGMLRRLGIAVTLLGNPTLMILDEPTAGLDPHERVRLKKILSNYSKDHIVIISTHIVSDVEGLCKTVLFLDEGKIVNVKKINQDSLDYSPEGLEKEYEMLLGDRNDSF